MLSLWRLTLLCGFLIGPSCCLLDSILSLPSLLNKDIDILKDKTQVLSLNLLEDLKKLKAIPIGQILGSALHDVENLAGKTVDAVLSKVAELLGLKIQDLVYLSIKPELSADGNSLVLRLPVNLAVALKINPFTSDLIKAQVSLDVLIQVKIATNDKTGVPSVLLGQCLVDQTSIKISILNSSVSLQARILEGLNGILKKIIPGLMEKQVCPVLEQYVNLIDVKKIQELINNLKTEKPVDTLAVSR